MVGQAGPKREQKVSLSLLSSSSKSPDTSRSPMWKVNESAGETKATAAAEEQKLLLDAPSFEEGTMRAWLSRVMITDQTDGHGQSW